ncbi:MAG: carbohydrate binding domain-containing protein, partial [Nanoarchaeota archaeon]|nr:carbohydrate binding domain-containing protein [Nanoarchaeota archaeon]
MSIKRVEGSRFWSIFLILFLAMSFFSVLGFYDKNYYGVDDSVNRITGDVGFIDVIVDWFKGLFGKETVGIPPDCECNLDNAVFVCGEDEICDVNPTPTCTFSEGNDGKCSFPPSSLIGSLNILNFGTNLNVGDSVNRALTLTAEGTSGGYLVINGVSFSQYSSVYSYDLELPHTLNVGDPEEMIITCAPSQEGGYNTVMQINSDAGNSPLDIALICAAPSQGGGSLKECEDGIDNDLDTFIDMADDGCGNTEDNDENNCGDGVRGGFEECEGTDLNNKNCVNYISSSSYIGGVLACTNQCTFDTSGCLSEFETEFYIDDVKVVEVGDNTNFVTNGDFENSLTNWDEYTSESVMVFEINNDGTYSKGGNSLHIKSISNYAGATQKPINLDSDTLYKFSADVYVVSGRVALTFWGDDRASMD